MLLYFVPVLQMKTWGPKWLLKTRSAGPRSRSSSDGFHVPKRVTAPWHSVWEMESRMIDPFFSQHSAVPRKGHPTKIKNRVCPADIHNSKRPAENLWQFTAEEASLILKGLWFLRMKTKSRLRVILSPKGILSMEKENASPGMTEKDGWSKSWDELCFKM